MLGFDYSNPGYYFVTTCTHMRRCCLSTITDNNMELSVIGQIVDDLIQDVFASSDTAMLDEYVIMPNHVHLLIYLSLDNADVTISDLVKRIKGASAAAVRREGLLGADVGPLWQKGFHDEITRNDQHLERVRAYIADNPRKWHEDKYSDDDIEDRIYI